MADRVPSDSLRWAWLAIAALALASRLIGLGTTPLAPSEAGRAVVAWDAARSGTWPDSSESPLLLVGNALLFTIFYPTAWLARLLPALAGTALVVLPFLWRRQIGELGALVASGLLLVSPLSLFAARRVDAAAIAILGAGLLLTLAFGSEAKGATRTAWLAWGLALGLTGGPAFYDALIAGVLVWLTLRRLGVSGHPRASLSWRRGVAIGLGAALIISVAGGLRWSGWAGVLDGAATWLGEWRIQADRGLAPAGLLLLYEPVLLILTATGLGLLAARPRAGLALAAGDRQGAPWGVALLGGVVALLIAARPGVSSEGVSLIVLPMALFGGWAADRLWGSLKLQERRWMGLHSLVSALFWAPALLALAQNARGIIGTDQILLILLGLMVLIGLQVLLVFIFLVQVPPALVWRSALTGLSAVFLFLQTGFGAGVAFVRSDQAIEPAIHTAGSHNLGHLTETVQRIGILREERLDSLQVVLLNRDDTLTASLRWALRGLGNVTSAVDWPEDPDALVIAPEAVDLSDTALDAEWQGMRFVAATTYAAPPPRCQLVPLACSEALRWYLYRESSNSPAQRSVILWRVPAEER
ncbi:MAG: hypothetical protein JXC32_01560 [Anaerolineae bacterium]|nr:hypothetical protein [Anaerolineae bacterium]